MIEVDLPDGSIAEFPDGTPQDVIKGALQKRFGPPQAAPAANAEAPAPAPAPAQAPAAAPQYWEAREPGLMERAGNVLRDFGIPIDRMGRDVQAADDLVRLGASGASLGFADKIAGAMGGDGTEAERAKTLAARERAGEAGTAAEIAGAVAAPLGLAGRGITLAGRGGTAAMTGLKGLGARTGLMGAEGAAYGGGTAAGHDQDVGTGAATGLAFGALGNVAGEALGSVVNKIAGAVKGKSPKVALEELQAAKNAAYDQADQLGVQYSADAFKNAVGDIAQTARADKISRVRHPKAVDMVEDLIGYVDKGASPTLTEMDQLRQVIWRDLAGSKDEAEAHFGKMMVGKIDDMIENAGATQVTSGNASDASEAIRNARELNRRWRNAQTLDDALIKAERRAASSASGGNEENAVRQNVRRILDDPKTSKFLNAEEKEALETVIRGSSGQNAARSAGNLLKGPGGWGAGSAGTMASLLTGNPAGLLALGAPMIGSGLKAISRGIGSKNEQLAEQLIRSGANPAAQSTMTPQQIEMLSRMLMGGGVATGGALQAR